jgi:hypothetical protein
LDAGGGFEDAGDGLVAFSTSLTLKTQVMQG